MANAFWMGWFEPDTKKDPAHVLAEATAFYRAKYGNTPNRLRVRNGLENTFARAAVEHGLTLETATFVQPREIWLMHQEKSSAQPLEEAPIPLETDPAGEPLPLAVWELQDA